MMADSELEAIHVLNSATRLAEAVVVSVRGTNRYRVRTAIPATTNFRFAVTYSSELSGHVSANIRETGRVEARTISANDID